MATRIVDFADGFSSASVPTNASTASTAIRLQQYASDAAYVSAQGAAIDGASYYNTTMDAIRIYENGAWLSIKSTRYASADPSTTDDVDSGFKVGDVWVNVTDDTSFVCVDSTASAALWRQIVDVNTAQTLSNKTLTSPTITGASFQSPSRIDAKKDTAANLATYASTAQNGELVYATDSKKFYVITDGALVETGGGAGDADTIHLIEAEGIQLADIDLTGQNASFDGGGTITAGSVTISTTAADLLSGTKVISYVPAANGQNDYFGFTKAIPIGLRGRYLGFQFHFKNDSTTVDTDFQFCVKIKDGAHAGEITTSYLEASYNSAGNGSTYHGAVFIPSDCTEVEFGWQNTSTTTTVELHVDKILITSNPYPTKEILTITGWTNSGASVITGTSSNPSKGTTTTDKVWYKRIGKDMHIRFEYRQTSAGSAGSGGYLLEIPGNVTVDTSLITAYGTAPGSTASQIFNENVVGFGDHQGNTSGLKSQASWYLYDSTHVACNFTDQTSSGNWGSAANNFAETNLSVNAYIIVPILEWNDTEEHIVLPTDSVSPTLVYRSTAQSIGSSSTWTTIQFDTVVSDRGGYFDSATNYEWTCPADGWFNISAQARFAVSASGSARQVQILLDNTTSIANSRVAEDAGVELTPSPSVTYPLRKGQTIKVQAWQNTGGALNVDGGLEYTKLSIHRVDRSFAASVPFVDVCTLSDVKTAGTHGGSTVTGSFLTRTLNTQDGGLGWCSLSSNQFTLQPGTYYVDSYQPFYSGVSEVKGLIYNVTDAANEIIGTSANGLTSAHSCVIVRGTITLTSAKTFDLRYKAASAIATSGLGIAVNAGVVEVYSTVTIYKLK